MSNIKKQFRRAAILYFLNGLPAPFAPGHDTDAIRSQNADKTYKLADVPAALAYLDAGHARRKIVITLE
jgi:hypothetical protein